MRHKLKIALAAILLLLVTRQVLASGRPPVSEGRGRKGGPWPVYDFNHSCRVDEQDLALMHDHFGSVAGDSRYVWLFDTDSDGDIDVADIMRVSGSFGQICRPGMDTG